MTRRRILISTLVAAFATSMIAAAGPPAATYGPTLTSPVSPALRTGPDGFIKRWFVLDPIPVFGLSRSQVQAMVHKQYFPGQFTVVPRDGQVENAAATPLTWRAVDTRLYNVNLFHLARALHKNSTNALFWAVTIVNSPREMHNVRLAIGSNAASVWWLNGQEVIGIYGNRQTVIDDGVSKRATLHQGPNVVRAAIVNSGGATDFCARFLDAHEKPIAGLSITLSKP